MTTKTTTTATTTTCSNCAEDILLDLEAGTLTSRVGRTTKTADLIYDADDTDGFLPMWDCPWCGYADSFDTTFEMAKALTPSSPTGATR